MTFTQIWDENIAAVTLKFRTFKVNIAKSLIGPCADHLKTGLWTLATVQALSISSLACGPCQCILSVHLHI